MVELLASVAMRGSCVSAVMLVTVRPSGTALAPLAKNGTFAREGFVISRTITREACGGLQHAYGLCT